MARRIIFGLVIAILILLGLVLVISMAISRASFPQTNGEIQLSGLDAPVDIYRDSLDIPHIYAQTPHDLFFAQGYIHAQDRFYQMDFYRHIGAGRLAEMFGEDALVQDRFLRTLGWLQVAEDEFAQFTPEVRQTLESYAAGVNAYLQDHQGKDLSLEYVVLGLINSDYHPEPWDVTDTLLFAKVMTWNLGEGLSSIVQRSVLLKTLTPEQLAELAPPYPQDHPVIVNHPHLTAQTAPALETASLLSTLSPALTELKATLTSLAPLVGAKGEGIGSNSWAVSGERTSTGQPLLANDPHLSALLPSIWYEVGLHCAPSGPDCPFNVVGFSFASAPGVVIGHNDRIAWGFTNLGPDITDLYIEKINPVNPNQYEVNGEWADMDVRKEVLQVAGGDPEELDVRTTRHGPVITQVMTDAYGLDDFAGDSGVDLPADYALALEWTGLQPGFILEAILGFNKAQDWESFRQAARDFSAPAQNLLYADVDGNIGYQSPGMIPIRNPDHEPDLPVPGWTDDYEWQGFIPFDDLPFAFNPPEGYIVTANNAVVGPEYPYRLSSVWDYGYRAERIVDLIEASPGPIDIAYMQKIQGDEMDLNAETLVPILLQIPMQDQHLQETRDLLSGWDSQTGMESAPAALFEVFWKNLLAQTFHDDLPEDYWPAGGARWYEVMRHIVEEPDSLWWDDQNTSQVEGRDEIFASAFAAGVDELESALGQNPDRWAWGDLHTLTLENQPLGTSGVALIEAIFNRGPFRSSGGSSIVNATGWNADSDSYGILSLPSMRMIVDLSDFTNSLAIHTTGQSGHAFDPHYTDMTDLWRLHQYHPQLWNEADIMDDAQGRLRLVPG